MLNIQADMRESVVINTLMKNQGTLVTSIGHTLRENSTCLSITKEEKEISKDKILMSSTMTTILSINTQRRAATIPPTTILTSVMVQRGQDTKEIHQLGNTTFL